MTGTNESGHEKSEHSWKKPEDQAREVSPPTHQAHQWYIRSFVPSGVISLGINGPENGSDKTLKGIFGATVEDIVFAAEKNIEQQAEDEFTVDVGKGFVLQAGEEILMTTPGKFEVVTGSLVEITAVGATPNAKTLGPNPYSPLLEEDAEDSGVESVHEVHEAREQNEQQREAAIKQMESKEHTHHGTMKSFGIGFAAVEALLGSYFAYKAHGTMGKVTGGLAILAGAGTLIQKLLDTKETAKGVLKINAMDHVGIWGGSKVEILAGNFVTVEAVERVFIEAAGMVSAGALVTSIFGTVSAEMMAGVNAGVLAGRSAELAARKDVIVEAHKGGLFLESKGSSQAAALCADEHGSSVFGAAGKNVQFEAHHNVHLEGKKNVHAVAEKVMAIHSAGSDDKALAIVADKGMVNVVGKNVTVRGENSIKLIVEGGGSIEINKSGVVVYDSSTSHKFMGGSLKSVVPGSVRVPAKKYEHEIEHLEKDMEEEAERVENLIKAKDAKKSSKA